MLFTRENFLFAGTCIIWYLASSFTNNFGKQIMNEFRFPVTLTFVQFGLVALLCLIGSPLGLGKLVLPTWRVLIHILPLAVFQVVSHILSSIAISRIPVSLVHTIKALSPLITVLAYTLGFRVKYGSKVYLSLIPLTLGVMLVCLNELKFQLFGFICALASTLVFVMQNIFSKKLFNQAASKTVIPNSKVPKLDKLNMLYTSSFVAFGLMSPIWMYSEGWTLIQPGAPRPSPGVLILFLLNGLTNFLQCLIAFWILSMVSPVTYSVASLFKRIFVIIVSILYFKDTFRVPQGFGVLLTFIGLWMYDDAKRDVAKADAKVAAIQEKLEKDSYLPVSRRGDGVEDG
jgi:solute carrier family 35 protein E1